MPPTCEEQREKRLGEFKAWFDGFTVVVRKLQANNSLPISHSNPGNFEFAEGAADAVNALYWRMMDELVRPMVKASNGDPDTLIDRFKICALLEISVITMQPIEMDDPASSRELNARLAYFCAICFLANWNELEQSAVENFVGKKIAENHLAWLTHYDPDDQTPPIFANAVTWQLIEENYKLNTLVARLAPAKK